MCSTGAITVSNASIEDSRGFAPSLSPIYIYFVVAGKFPVLLLAYGPNSASSIVCACTICMQLEFSSRLFAE